MSDGPTIKPAGFAVIILFIGLCLGGGWWLFNKRDAGSAPVAPNSPVPAPRSPLPAESTVTLGVAYGSEKRKWFEWAAEAFKATPAGQGIAIDLKPMGSIEAGQAIVKGDTSIQMWVPASSQAVAAFRAD